MNNETATVLYRIFVGTIYTILIAGGFYVVVVFLYATLLSAKEKLAEVREAADAYMDRVRRIRRAKRRARRRAQVAYNRAMREVKM